MDLKAQRFKLVDEARTIIAGAKTAARDLTDDERTQLEQKQQQVADLTAKIDRAEKDEALLKGFDQFAPTDDDSDDDSEGVKAAPSLGAHFAKHVKADRLVQLKNQRGTTLTVPEWRAKANTDPNTQPSVFTAPLMTQYDRTFVRAFRRPTVTDLFGQGTVGVGTNAISYFVEGGVEGNFATVAEGGQKPQLHFTDPTMKTDAVRKIAGWWDTSDEMIEDLDFWVSEINNRGLYVLSLVEESQVLNGDGTGTNLLGVTQRSGIQTVVKGVAPDTVQDTLFRAIMAVQTATGLPADGIVIHPTDYQALRLTKDANGQYFGGGFFAGQYGNGGVPEQPPIWGLRTVVSAAVAAGSPLVGAFQAAATVYRKGGIRVESTNSDASKFTKDIVTTRVEERLALAVRLPAAIVKATI